MIKYNGMEIFRNFNPFLKEIEVIITWHDRSLYGALVTKYNLAVRVASNFYLSINKTVNPTKIL
jgi:hypothetical protein